MIKYKKIGEGVPVEKDLEEKIVALLEGTELNSSVPALLQVTLKLMAIGLENPREDFSRVLTLGLHMALARDFAFDIMERMPAEATRLRAEIAFFEKQQ